MESTAANACRIAKSGRGNYRSRFVNATVQDLLKTHRSRQDDSTSWLTASRFAAILAGLIAVYFWEVALGSHTFFYRDYSLFGYPNADFLSSSISLGALPLWNPASHCGIPFLAQWNTLTCYPPALLASALPLPWSLGYFCLLHLMAAGMTMRALALRWTGNELAAAVAGLAYAFNGMSLNCMMWPNFMAALAWAPLVLLTAPEAWRAGGRRLVWAALSGALQMLSGCPEIILLTWVSVAPLFINDFVSTREERKRMALNLAGLLALVTGLAAIQLFPFLQLLVHSQRDSGYGEGHWPMPLLGILNFFVPLFRCTPGTLGGVYSQYDQQFTSSYYLGIGIVLLAATAVFHLRDRRVRILGFASLLFIVMAWGDAGGLHLAVRKIFPPIGFARYPVKFLFGAAMLIPILAAFGFKRLWSRGRRDTNEPASERTLLLGVATIVAIAVVISMVAPDRKEDWLVTLKSGISRLFLLAAFLLAIPYAARIQKSTARIAAQCGLLALLALDLATHAPRQNPTVITWAYSSEAAPRDLIPPEGYRAMLAPTHRAVLNQIANPDHLGFCLGQRHALSHNWNLVEGIPKIDGFCSLQLRKQYAVWKVLYEGEAPPPEGLLDFLGASQISDPVSLFKWAARANALPLVTAGQSPVMVNNENEALGRLASPDFNPREIVLLNSEDRAEVTDVQSHAARIESVARPSAQALKIEVNATEPSMIVIAQSHYAPWKATINGSSAPILPANHAFQAVKVPAGRSTVRLEYRDTAFHLGAVVSFLTFAACAAILWRVRRRSSATASNHASEN